MSCNNLLLTVCCILNLVVTTFSYMCTNEAVLSDKSGESIIKTFVDCNQVFEICCEVGCCPRFSHAHIWIFAAVISFVIFICLFGCWLLCCKEKFRQDRTATRTNEDLVDSPLTISIPQTQNTVVVAENQNNSVPVTPPPTYEEATAMR